MSGGITRKFDHEKGKRQARVHNEGYRERILEEGDSFDRGGKTMVKMLTFRRSAVLLNLKPYYLDDKRSLLESLKRHWRFVIEGETGTISQLLKKPKVSARVTDLFEIMSRSIIRADEILGVAEHPKTKRKYYLVEFRCNIRPEDPFPNPVFKKRLAFSVKLVGPALIG